MRQLFLPCFIPSFCCLVTLSHCFDDTLNHHTSSSLPYSMKLSSNSIDNNNAQPQLTTLCQTGSQGTSHHNCKPTAVEFFPTLVNHDTDKIMMLSFGNDEDSSKLALCSPESESTSMQPTQVTNTINLMSHVFCRQMGYMTYLSRRATNVRDDRDRALWPTAVCNGTEQRLEDCYWPEASVTSCKHVVEVTCGDCSKYYSHIDDGIIVSPGFPVSFPFTVQCDWLIHTQLGIGIELRFLFFNLPTSQLPQEQIGRSPCIASNAFIEIHPNPSSPTSLLSDDSQGTSLESDTLSNSQRYCVTRNPERRMIIKSKAVWIHFSSGIHSSFLSTYSRRLSPVRRPIGLKIHFKALPVDVMNTGEASEDMPMHPYIILGIVATVGFVLLILIACYICMRIRERRHGRGRFGTSNVGVGICRTTTASTSPGGSSCSTSTGTTPKKWRRNFCSLERMTANNAFTVNNKSFMRHGMKMNDHNYEEIPAAQRPIVPPRVTDPLMAASRQAAVARSESGPVESRNGNANLLPRQYPEQYPGQHPGQQQNHCPKLPAGRSLLSASFRSPPTYVSRHYMQIVCDAEGNCQYIPREEIQDSEVFARPSANNKLVHPLPFPRTTRESVSSNRFIGNLPPHLEEDSDISAKEDSVLPPYSQAVKLCKSPERVALKASRTKSSSSVSTV